MFLFINLYSAGSEFSEDKFVAKVKMEIVVSKDQVSRVTSLYRLETKRCFPSK